jgi:hypothetical protein
MSKGVWKNIGGVWQAINEIWRNNNGSWRDGVVPYIKVAGIWKKCMEISTIPTYLTVNASGWTILSGPSMSTYYGTVSFDGATTDHDIGTLHIHCRVYDRLYMLAADIDFYNGPYSAYDSLDGYSEVVYPYTPPIPNLGYHLILDFDES